MSKGVIFREYFDYVIIVLVIYDKHVSCMTRKGSDVSRGYKGKILL